MNSCHKSVVIIGAGPTGLTLANLLGLSAVETLVIERNPTTVQEPRAVSIDDESLRTIQAIKLIDRVLPDVLFGYGAHYFTPGGRCFAKVEPQAREFAYPRRSAFRQPLLEVQLRDGLKRFSNVETWFNSEVIGVEPDDDGVKLQVRDLDGQVVTVTSDYVAACDGGKSSIRRRLGIDLVGTTFAERWLIIDLEESKDDFPHTKVFCDPRRPCVSVPGPHAGRRLEFMLFADEKDEDAVRPEFVGRLLAAHGANAEGKAQRVRVYSFHARVANRWSDGRIFLAGDAAHLTPPFAGQGMNMGLRDAFNLGWKLAAVITGKLGPELLNSYERERRPHSQAMVDLAVTMSRVTMPKTWASALTVQLGFRLLALFPAARDYIVEMKFKPKPRFTDGFLIRDSKSPQTTLVGSMFPQGNVMRLDGRRTLLDEIVGDSFALIAFGRSPEKGLAGWTQPIWSSIGARRVAIRSIPCLMATNHTVDQCVVDSDYIFAKAWRYYAGQVLLVRPDRYIMAAFPQSDPSASAKLVERLVEPTWAIPGHTHPKLVPCP